MTEYKFEVGQRVVIQLDTEYPNGRYKVGTVEKVTPTQVTVDGKRYMRSYPCSEYGRSGSWHSNNLQLDMTPEQAEERNAEWRKWRGIEIRRNKLKKLSWGTHSVSDEDVVKVYDYLDSLGLIKGEP